MNVGVCTLKLHFPENHSLKEKRRILKSIVSRLRNQFNISIAEIDAQDKWQLAVLGVTCVSNCNQRANDILFQVINFVIHNYPEVELVSQEIEILPVS